MRMAQDGRVARTTGTRSQPGLVVGMGSESLPSRQAVVQMSSNSILRIMSATETDLSLRPALERCIFTVISEMPIS